MRTVPVFALVSLLAACAATHTPSLDPPRAWSQTPAEIGKLPVGRIVSVERVMLRNLSPGDDHARRAMFGFLADVGKSVQPVRESYYRYTIRMEGTNENVVREEYPSYEVGACVALRSDPGMVVPAVPGACR